VIDFADWLKEKRACIEAVKWAKGKTAAQAYAECARGDWMLWTARRLFDDKRVALAACDCAEPAIEARRAWARGEATIEQVRLAAAAAASAAASADASAATAAKAARAASLRASADIVRRHFSLAEFLAALENSAVEAL
jgi:hypothetical protein